jgi:general secretion pathway protein D
LGGVSQPIIGQRKVQHDIRMREGEVGLLGGLINTEDDKSVTGIPGLSSIPLFGNLFKGSSVNHNRDELMIVVIPHVIRQPEITAENLKTVAVGTTTITRLNHAPRPQTSTAAAVPSVAQIQPPPPPSPVLPAAVPAVTAPAVNNPLPVPPSAGMPPATAPPLAPGAEPPPTGGAPTAQFNGPTRVYFKPERVEAAAGGTFSVAVALDNGMDVASAPMIIEFDPKLVHLNDITQGGLLSSTGQKPVFNKNIQNERGAASVILNVIPNNPGVTAASGTLVTLDFQAVGAGSGTVTIRSLAVKNSRGSVIHESSPQLTVTVK